MTKTPHRCPKCGLATSTAKLLKAHTCKGALVVVPPQKLAVVTSEVPLHNLYHRNAMLSTAMAACWFVLAGAELARKKKEVGHGKWEKWVKGNCEYSDDTAGKYMKVAERVKDKALKASAKGGGANPDLDRFLELLEKPASSLAQDEQLTLLKSVHGLTDGATISELYEDFGIVKKLKSRGGDTTPKDGTPAVRMSKAQQAQAHWHGLQEQLFQCISPASIALLARLPDMTDEPDKTAALHFLDEFTGIVSTAVRDARKIAKGRA